MTNHVIGFVIGISQWKMHYLIHGVVLGLIISLTASIRFLTDDILTFILYALAGALYGIIIVLLAAKAFKSPL